MTGADASVGVFVITHNRAEELCRTLDQLVALSEGPSTTPSTTPATSPSPTPTIVVVDNASVDDTVERVGRRHPDITLLRSDRNLGGAARVLGARALDTRYVAFCDDDAWWTPGSLRRAVQHLDRCPGMAAVCGAVVVVTPPDRRPRTDPTSVVMARSPLPARPGQPGPRLVGLIASATVIRRDLFLAHGGFEARFGVGGEEALLALDLLDAGWDLCFAPGCVLVHQPSARRVSSRDRRIGEVCTELLTVWLRFPFPALLAATVRTLLADLPSAGPGALAALRHLPWVCASRRPVRRSVQELRRTVDRADRADRRTGTRPRTRTRRSPGLPVANDLPVGDRPSRRVLRATRLRHPSAGYRSGAVSSNPAPGTGPPGRTDRAATPLDRAAGHTGR